MEAGVVAAKQILSVWPLLVWADWPDCVLVGATHSACFAEL